jgi:lysozyme
MSILLEQLKRHEGFSSTIYTDTTGHLSIGYGRNLSSIGISVEEALYLLGNKKELFNNPYLKPYLKDNVYFLGYERDISNIGITKGEAHHLLVNDVERAKHITERFICSAPISKIRYEVFVNMAFNLGPKLLKFERTRQYIKEQDWDRASIEILNSLWATQVKGRATELSHQLLNDEYAVL